MKSLVVALIVSGSVGVGIGQRNPTALEKKRDRSQVLGTTDRESTHPTASTDSAVVAGKRVEVEKIEPVRVLSQPRASRPPNSGTICLQGTVLLKVELLYDGTVGKILVVRGLPHGFTEQAVLAARKISFVPALKGGVPMTRVKTFEYPFGIYH